MNAEQLQRLYALSAGMLAKLGRTYGQVLILVGAKSGQLEMREQIAEAIFGLAEDADFDEEQ